MPDVFVSYSQKDRAVANALADKLTAVGLSVWWDTELVGGEAFRKAIEQQLEAARVVLVLWSAESIGSRYVLDEADVAAATGKLVSILVGGLAPKSMPLGFRTIQSVDAHDFEAISRALRNRGLALQAGSGAGSRSVRPEHMMDNETKEEEAWKFVLAKRSPKLASDFMKQFPKA